MRRFLKFFCKRVSFLHVSNFLSFLVLSTCLSLSLSLALPEYVWIRQAIDDF